MCGILGVIGPAAARLAARRFNLALDRIAHRGPDSSGTWRDDAAWLGHRRLAIIDLTEDGHQPMVDPASGLVIVFNGEIYNYRELRSELVSLGHHFHSQSDTEVLLRGYLQWGGDVQQRCNGMWAAAIWNPSTQTLFLTRDRFGKKPLYFARVDASLWFASEPKALHSLRPDLAEADPAALVDLVVNSRLHLGERTFYRRIQALPPAYCGTWDARADRLETRRYWDYPDAGSPIADGERDEAFGALFADAVQLRLRSDVPLGLTLSGGLDSSAVLAAAGQHAAEPPRSYTSVYGQARQGELGWAETAARCAGTSVLQVRSSMDDWQSMLPAVVAHLDAPGQSPAVLPLWSIMKRARADGVPVLLEGQGADEILGGYTWYPAAQAVSLARQGDLRGFSRICRSMSEAFTWRWTVGWLARQAAPGLGTRLTRTRRHRLFRADVIDAWRQRGEDPTLSRAGRGYEPLYRAMWQDHAFEVLPGLLHYGDSISMAHGIESRLPFLDFRLVEWVFRHRPTLLEHGDTKAPLRAYLRSRGFAPIAERRDKLGYPVPMTDWYRSIGGRLIDEIVATPGAPIWDLMSPAHVAELAIEAKRGSMAGAMHLFKFLTAELWLRELQSRRTLDALEPAPLAA